MGHSVFLALADKFLLCGIHFENFLRYQTNPQYRQDRVKESLGKQ